MADGPNALDLRVAVLFDKAGLNHLQRITNLAPPDVPDFLFRSSLQSSSDEARLLLAHQRTTGAGYKPPERQLRHRLSTTRLKEKSDPVNWTFTKYEVAKAFHSVVSLESLPPPDIAQAVLNHASVASLDELWYQFLDSNLEKGVLGRLWRTKPNVYPEMPWLDNATRKNNLDYIRLMCHAGLKQEVLDRAFSIALSNHSMEAIRLLLSYGAAASACIDSIRERVGMNDVALAKLLLSAPNAMSIKDWKFCIQSQTAKAPAVLTLCLKRNPVLASGQMLLETLESHNFEAVALILAYSSFNEDFLGVREDACRLACLIDDSTERNKAFTILAESEWVTDTESLRQELMKNVRLRNLRLVRTLTNAGISLDVEPNNALSWAVSGMDLDMLELFRDGQFCSSVSSALKFVPDTASEQDMLQLLHIFRSRLGPASETLHSHLIRATKKQHSQLVHILVECGASAEFQQAYSVRIAIEKADFNMLSILLKGKCSREKMSTTILLALSMKSRSSRLEAVRSLLNVGVPPQELGSPLQFVVSEGGEVDLRLVQLLLVYNAPVDGLENDGNTSVSIATRRGNLDLLKTLCDADPKVDTLSRAIPLAFRTKDECGYDVALEMIKLLLQKGACGPPVHYTLLSAASQDPRLDIVGALVEYGADANHSDGACFAVAIKTRKSELLQILCLGSPPTQATIKSVLFDALDPQWFEIQALDALLSSCSSPAAALNSAWSFDRMKSNPNIAIILPCFLRHGLDVDIGNGDLLRLAVSKENVVLLRAVFSSNPSTATLKSAFRAAASVPATKATLEIMELLLWQAQSTEIGQSELLWHMTCTALDGDTAGLRIILRHRADVNFNEGKAISAAALAGSFEVLDMLLLSRPTPVSINKASLAVASSALGPKQKKDLLERLVVANSAASVQDLSDLLADSVSSAPQCERLPMLLLARGAEPRLETFRTSLGECSPDLYVALASKIQNADTARGVFKHVRNASITSDQRYRIYKCLVGHKISSDELSEALLDSLRATNFTNLNLPKLLLQHGAAVEHGRAKALQLALSDAKSFEAFMLLSQGIEDDRMAGVAFDLATRTDLGSHSERAMVYRCLLEWNISESSLYHALVGFLKAGHSDSALVQLLLRKGADPNKNFAECFILACTADAEPEFRALSRHANLGTVWQTLLTHYKEEGHVVRWFNMCLEERPRGAKIEQDELLFQCMRKFPNGSAALKLLLDSGVSASAKKTYSICPAWQPEQCTALIWALFSKPRIENDAILALLSRGAGSGLLHINPCFFRGHQGLQISQHFRHTLHR